MSPDTQLFVTDQAERYAAAPAPKLLVTRGVIVAQAGLPEAAVAAFNARHIHISTVGWADAMDDIRRWRDALAGVPLTVNRWLATRRPEAQRHSLLQMATLEMGIERHTWRRWFDRLPALLAEAGLVVSSIALVVRPIALAFVHEAAGRYPQWVWRLETPGLRPAWQRRLGRWGRGWLQRIRSSLRPLPPPMVTSGRRRVLYYVGRNHQLFEQFRALFHDAEFAARHEVLVLLYREPSQALDAARDVPGYLGPTPYQVLCLDAFERGAPVSGAGGLYAALAALDPAAAAYGELDLLHDWLGLYAALDAALRWYRPDVVLHNNFYDHSRALSDVARFHGVPSVNAQYSLVADLPSLPYDIRFDVRVLINQASADLFRRAGDPTPQHVVAGFSKLHALPRSWPRREALFAELGLDPERATVFFGSTYGWGLDYEKQVFARQLVRLCARHGWNLLIKKHPSEGDDLVAACLAEQPQPHQVIVPHGFASLAELIAYSDVVLNQSSSLVAEALYYYKPFAFLGLDTEHPGYYKTIYEDFIPFIADAAGLEAFLLDATSAEGRARWHPLLASIWQKYLGGSADQSVRRLKEVLDSAQSTRDTQ